MRMSQSLIFIRNLVGCSEWWGAYKDAGAYRALHVFLSRNRVSISSLISSSHLTSLSRFVSHPPNHSLVRISRFPLVSEDSINPTTTTTYQPTIRTKQIKLSNYTTETPRLTSPYLHDLSKAKSSEKQIHYGFQRSPLPDSSSHPTA